MVLLFYFGEWPGRAMQYQFPILLMSLLMSISGFSSLPKNRCVVKKAHGKRRTRMRRILIAMGKTRVD
jgi:hypothetical protein